ncbi:MAG: ABC transporter permease [Saprospiraceae bacterium]|nr:ABC transporter permease [Saprospiraceae bacterium]MBK6667050.1 ABC transporter permease [Saprospiraceae bacterium]MBK9584062.1 ABC transporter permease [Saprospiraceae bacterium]MBP6538860.1 ABC transporter permease [Saprospiraceae bacterium]MBP8212521.1 ABC transporter permease [Saprospiraceae bacterium]
MNKIWLVTQREYLTRVTNKTFILTTLLAPLGILVFMAAVVLVMSTGSDKAKIINVYDPSGLLQNEFKSRDNLTFKFSNESMDAQKTLYKEKKINGILELPPLTDSLAKSYVYKYHSDDQLAMDENFAIESAIGKKIRDFKLKKLNIDAKTLENLDTDVQAEPETILEDKKISSITTIVSSALGGIVGYAMFFIILFYGMQVMRSVMEEKINRIIEVLISSLKPFELMMGKVLGVGLVGLTQIGIWLILMPIIYFIGAALFGINTEAMPNPVNDMNPEVALTFQSKASQIFLELRSMNWWFILPLTLFYFLAGYFAYSALFAAIGSAVGEDINDANSLTFPIMMPLIFSIYIGFSAVNAPDSSLAVWSSMIPLLSSIVMPVRLPFDPPWWQIGISVVSLIIFTIFLVWLAARIYRVGILMYGKKATFKELSKWIFYKD